MSQKSEFTELVGVIVSEVFPDDKESFELAGQKLIDDAFNGVKLRGRGVRAPGEFQFLKETKDVLQIIGVIWSTYKMLTEIKAKLTQNAAQRSTSVSLAEKWKTRLMAEGVPQSSAEAIVEKYAVQLEELVTKQNDEPKHPPS